MAKIIDGDDLSVGGASFTGEISGTTLTVTAVTSGFIDVNAVIPGRVLPLEQLSRPKVQAQAEPELTRWINRKP